VGVSKEDLEDLSRLLDLDERKPILLLLVGIRESKDIVEDGGDCSKVESSSGEEDSVRGLNDEVCSVVGSEDGRVGGVGGRSGRFGRHGERRRGEKLVGGGGG